MISNTIQLQKNTIQFNNKIQRMKCIYHFFKEIVFSTKSQKQNKFLLANWQLNNQDMMKQMKTWEGKWACKISIRTMKMLTKCKTVFQLKVHLFTKNNLSITKLLNLWKEYIHRSFHSKKRKITNKMKKGV